MLLRGVNVGGSNKLPMKDLCAMVVDLGFDDVSSYIQSGNVVLRSDREPADIAAAIRAGITDRFGFTCALTLRTRSQMAAVIESSPFAAGAADVGHLHVTFLIPPTTGAEARDAVATLDLSSYAPEELQVIGDEIHLHLPGGMGRSRLAVDVAKRKSVSGTTRNWRTVNELAARLAALT